MVIAENTRSLWFLAEMKKKLISSLVLGATKISGINLNYFLNCKSNNIIPVFK